MIVGVIYDSRFMIVGIGYTGGEWYSNIINDSRCSI